MRYFHQVRGFGFDPSQFSFMASPGGDFALKHGWTPNVRNVGGAPMFADASPTAASAPSGSTTLVRGAGAGASTLAIGDNVLTPTDGLYTDQWHFDLMGNGGGRAYVETIWTEFSGAGIHVGIYDSGVQSTHYDLNDNYDPTYEVTVDGGVVSGDPIDNPSAGDGHGTAVAGIIGAELNGDGVVGIAWGSSLTGVNIFDPSGAAYINAGDISGFLEAAHQMATFDVTNNSWGAFPGFYLDNGLAQPGGFAALVNAEFEYAVVNGRGGLGTNIVKAAGNDRLDSNGDGLNASRFTITVNALLENGFAAKYSNFGANTLVSAAGGDYSAGDGTRLITTTDLLGDDGFNTAADPSGLEDFTDVMNGTSSATPMVSGVIALMLDANADLGWRDVQEILALSAFHTGSDIGTGPGLNEEHVWYFNGANNWNGGGMHFSEDYGYGNVDVFGAVRMAEAYALMGLAPKTSANEMTASTAVFNTSLAIPDNNALGVTYSFNLASNLKIEQVELSLNFTHTYPSDLDIFLTSPDGVTVQVQTHSSASSYGDNFFNTTWVYGIEALKGELSAGQWTLTVADVQALDTGTLNSVQLTVHGQTPSVANLYTYTDEFSQMAELDSSRMTLTDTNGGKDWINMAALSFDVDLDLNPGVVTAFGLTIAPGSVIENAITGDGDDVITGNSVANKLYGMRGADTLTGGGGADQLFGGDGVDTASYATSAAAVSVNLGAGSAGGGDATGDALSGIENLIGSNSNDTLTGDGGVNRLEGGLGNDTLDGKAGADTMIGGNGNDTYIVDVAGDKTTETSAAGGIDLLKSSVTRTLGANLENLILTGANAINGTGNGLANTLTGNAKANVLKGMNGADTLIGGAGIDTLTGGSGADKFVLNAAAKATNADKITDFTHSSDKIQLENSVFTTLGAGTGTLAAAKFFAGANAHDADDRILYDGATGKLYYDSNGSAAGHKVLIATLDAHLTVTASDFQVI